jgi:hypothetical protein
MPLSHPPKGKVSSSNQIEFYQKVNPLARPESLEHLSKICRQRIVRQHNRVHGRQRYPTTINGFFDMLRSILKKYNGTTAPGIRP